MSFPISAIRFEHFHGNLLGFGNPKPRLSWTYDPQHSPASSDNVELRVIRSMPGEAPQEQRIVVPADSNVLLDWPFEPLKARERATLSARSCAKSGIANGDWSPENWVEMGILGPEDRWAAMISPAWNDPQSDWRHAPILRTEFTLKNEPVWARLYLSAYGLVEAEINGSRIGDDILTPGWTNYNDRLPYWTYDVLPELHSGDNALGIWLGDGWYRGRLGFRGGQVNIYGDRLGVFSQLEVAYADGSTDRFCSNTYDGTWHAARGPIVSSGMCEGERYDARLEQPGWSKPGFHEDDQWGPVAELKFDALKLQEPMLGAVRPITEHRPVTIEKRDEGAFMIDFGQNCTQRIRFRIHGFNKGHQFKVQHAEVLEPDGTLATEPLRRGLQIDTYTSNGTDCEWEPRFTIHGFRYAFVENWPGDLTADDIVAIAYGSELERTGWFDSSNAIVNRLHQNVIWSMRSNFVSIPTDCPQRDERLGWTGDVSLFVPTAAFLYDTHAFLSNWLVDVESDTQTYGTVPYYVPFVPLGEWRVTEAIAIWGDCTVLVPWTLYMADGDTRALSDNYDLARLWVDEVAGYLSDDGVWDRKPKLMHGQLGDWLDPSAPPDDFAKAMTAKELVATAFYAHSTKLLARMSEILGHTHDAKRYGDLAEHVKAGFLHRFVDSTGVMTSDTQCAYALAITFGLLDDSPELKSFAGRRLAQLVREAGYVVSTGFAGTPYVLPALTATGHIEEAYGLFLSQDCPSWLYQVRMGATTTWERWDSMRPDGSVNPGVSMTSFNHYSLGSVVDWVHHTIGGIEALTPGWKKFLVKPQPGGGIDHAHVKHLTPHGEIDCEWSQHDNVIDLSLTVPADSTAIVEIADQVSTLSAGVYQLSYSLN